ncbi:hypothetical protein FOZ62_017658 [Perkinsus olseni]|uniref:Uncharacterized protein n=1 Tax=Perkinsus olseni TaxID=32597 RepID=A0A7J6QE99_PEROL|nr:hypothetical protein FOZ62_017658 [Perkinsus olseni]
MFCIDPLPYGGKLRASDVVNRGGSPGGIFSVRKDILDRVQLMNDSTAELPIVVTLHCAFKLGGEGEDEEVPEDRFVEAAIGAACKRFLGEMGAKRIDWTLDEVTATPDSAAGDFTVRVKVTEAGRRRRAKSRSNRAMSIRESYGK